MQNKLIYRYRYQKLTLLINKKKSECLYLMLRINVPFQDYNDNYQ